MMPRFSYADLLRLQSVDDVKVSPDGERVAYTVSAIDLQEDRSTESMWVLQVRSKRTVQVALRSASAPAWSPNGQRLAVVSQSQNGKSAVTLLRADNLVAVQSFSVASAPTNLVWSPDGQSLAFTLLVPDVVHPSFLQEAVDGAEEKLGKPSDGRWALPVQLTQAARYRRDGGTWLGAGHEHLFVLSTVDGKVRQVGAESFDDLEPAWTSDSTSLLFTSDRRPERTHAVRELSIYKTNLATGNTVRLTHARGNFGAPSVSPDGQWIAYTGYDARPVNYTRNDLYTMRADGTEPHRVAAQLDRDIYDPRWAADSRSLYAEYSDHGIFRLGLFGLDGEVKQLVSGIDAGFSISRGGDIAYAGSTPTGPNELRLKRTGVDPVVLTSLNAFLDHRKLAQLLHLEAKSSADGVRVEGWALLPAGASGHTRLPTILALHGGPFGSDGPNWSSAFQLYAAAGYAVIYVNYRGSTSYGTSFSEPANHNFPSCAFDDVMSIVDEGLRLGFVDPKRSFVTGGSAGGQLTAWITGKTKRFSAAVAEKPVINVLSDSLTTDQYLAAPDTDEGDPWTRDKELWAQSPLSLAGSMTTPMLFIVGEEDYRTPLDQTLQLYDALQLKNVPTALMRVPGAGHESLASRPSQFVAEIAATLAWFQEYALPSPQ